MILKELDKLDISCGRQIDDNLVAVFHSYLFELFKCIPNVWTEFVLLFILSPG